MLHHRMRAASGARGGAAPPAPDILSAWYFNEGSGGSASDSFGSNNGTLTSTSLWTPNGIIGSAVQGTGTSSHFVNLPSGANILGLSTTDTKFGIFFWFYLSATPNDNTILMLNKRNSTTAADNKGAYFQILPGGEVRFTVEEGNAGGYNGSANGNWDTGLSVTAGWNLVICNRTPTSASCIVRNSGGRFEDSITGSFGNMLLNDTARGNRIGSYIANLFTLEANNRIDLMGVYDGPIDSTLEDFLWNSGSGQEP